MEVSSKEFDSINEVYMNCDLDKDEFCKMWIKMNKTRVAKAIAERKEAEKREADRERAFELYNSLSLLNDSKLTCLCVSDKEESFLKSIGVEMQSQSSYEEYPHFIRNYEATYKIGCYLGINA